MWLLLDCKDIFSEIRGPALDDTTLIYHVTKMFSILCMGRSRGGTPPLKNHKNIGVLCNSGPDPLKFTKLLSQHSMLDHHRPASETMAFHWRADDGLFIAVFVSSIPLSTKKQLKTFLSLDPL